VTITSRTRSPQSGPTPSCCTRWRKSSRQDQPAPQGNQGLDAARYVPWSDAPQLPRFFEDGSPGAPSSPRSAAIGKIALVVNLLTEDNLPSYTTRSPPSSAVTAPWGTWVHRWTAEENRHGIVMRDYLSPPAAVDPDELERFG